MIGGFTITIGCVHFVTVSQQMYSQARHRSGLMGEGEFDPWRQE
jgi:hypothetical protein